MIDSLIALVNESVPQPVKLCEVMVPDSRYTFLIRPCGAHLVSEGEQTVCAWGHVQKEEK